MTKNRISHGSISTGIGGFDFGADENDIQTKWTCEIDPLRRDILQWRYPKAKHYTDVRKLRNPPYVDIISFGFPCQDISQANPYGKGLEGDKSGLFYEGWRVIRKRRPAVVVFENSPMLIHKGLGTILGLLASEGYNAEWQIISCKRFGLPHLRKRLFIVAYPNKIGCKTHRGISGKKSGEIVPAQSRRPQLFQSEFNGNASWEDWRETIGSVSYLDDGIPKNILYGLLASAGDTVSPRITSWIFGKIKEAINAKV